MAALGLRTDGLTLYVLSGVWLLLLNIMSETHAGCSQYWSFAFCSLLSTILSWNVPVCVLTFLLMDSWVVHFGSFINKIAVSSLVYALQSAFVLVSVHPGGGLLGNRTGVCPARTVVPNENSSCFTSLSTPGAVSLLNFGYLGGWMVLPHCDLPYFSDD